MVHLKTPTECPYCKGEVILTSNKEIYGREYGNGFCYLCVECGASVGTHNGKAHRPLGILATREMKILKKCCHDLFDFPWKMKWVSRSTLYHRLANKLGIDVKDCHFGYFDTVQLLAAIEILSKQNWWKAGDNK